MNLRRTRVYRKQVIKTKPLFSVGPTTARYLVLLLLAVFSLLYLVQSAQGSDRALQLRQEEEKQSELRQELTTLEVQSSRLQSLQNLNQSAATQGLVPVTESPETITISPSP